MTPDELKPNPGLLGGLYGYITEVEHPEDRRKRKPNRRKLMIVREGTLAERVIARLHQLDYEVPSLEQLNFAVTMCANGHWYIYTMSPTPYWQWIKGRRRRAHTGRHIYKYGHRIDLEE